MLLLRRGLAAYRSHRLLATLPDAALDAVHNVDDFQRLARGVLERPLYEYLASGSGDEVTLRENRAAFGRYALRPRALRPVDTLSTACELFGNELTLPVFASPAGVHSLVDGEGERATARACGRAGVLFGLSQHATVCIEDVAAAAPGAHRWYQSYLLKDRDATLDLVRRAVAAGYRGIFLTVDSVRFGFREVDARNNFCALPPPLTLANYVATPPGIGAAAWEAREHKAWDQNSEALFDTAASWDAVSWLREELDRLDPSIPLVVKGVMTGEDAALAVAHGADGVYVSTHGGRQLDETLGALDALPEVVAAVPGTPVLLDSGVRRGTDVVKALALGAKAVGVGKPLFFSLAIGGERGVDKLFEILAEETRVAMALTGCASLADISADVCVRRCL
jgi:isopentenyl diphosphate isomerase/L-lactate dehydrogenase-like FMN-dependent dehydrogenase